MHVIIDGTTTQDQFAFSGPGRYTRNIILTLIKQYPDTEYSVLLFEGKDSTLNGEIEKYPNAKIERVGKYRLNDYKNDIYYFTQILPVIKKIRRKDSVYFCPYFWRNFPSGIMPTVLFIHDMNLPMFNMYSQQSSFHNFIRKLQYWKTLNKAMKCEYLLANSKTTMDDFLRYYPKFPKEKMIVSYLGVEIEEKTVSIEDTLPSDWKKRGYFIYFGAGINRSKNSLGVIMGYIEFLKHLQDKDEAPYLVISGGKFENRGQKEVKELYEAIEGSDAKGNVIFSGFYTDEARYSLLHNSIAFIHLSLSEGFGIAPIEAMRSKTPAILHKNPVYEELFTNVSVLVDGNSPDDVGNAIYGVYEKPAKYAEMVKRAYKLSQKYTWEECADITHNILEKVYNSHSF